MNTLPDITVRPATPDDLPAIFDLLTKNHLPTDGLAGHEETTLIACMGHDIVGSAALEVYERAALLRSVSVSPAIQKRGLGQRLTQAALDMAAGRGIQQVYLLTETASEFFPRFGFRATTRDSVPSSVRQSVEFKTACPDSALVMFREL